MYLTNASLCHIQTLHVCETPGACSSGTLSKSKSMQFMFVCFRKYMTHLTIQHTVYRVKLFLYIFHCFGGKILCCLNSLLPVFKWGVLSNFWSYTLVSVSQSYLIFWPISIKLSPVSGLWNDYANNCVHFEEEKKTTQNWKKLPPKRS